MPLYVFDYSKLRGKIREKFGTQEKFANCIEMSDQLVSGRLNNQSSWKQSEILRACNALGIPKQNIPDFFYTLSSEIPNTIC